MVRKEGKNENCEDVVLNIMKVPDSDIYCQAHPMGEICIDIAHRNGKKRDGENPGNRPIVVRFVTKKGKLLILKNVRQLNGIKFSVTDQLPPLI